MSDTPNRMPLVRAQQIVDAINARSFLVMGLREDLNGLVSLADVSLPEMIEAVTIVNAENLRRRTASEGSYTINVVPADRLVAAVFVLENYRPSGQAIAASIVDGRDQLLAVLFANSGPEGDAS